MAEQSMRDRLRVKVQGVVWNASNYPKRAQPYILGQDIVPLTTAIVDAILPLIEEAVTAERKRCALIAETVRLPLDLPSYHRDEVHAIVAEAIREGSSREPEPFCQVPVNVGAETVYCVREAGHEGVHRDYQDREWEGRS